MTDSDRDPLLRPFTRLSTRTVFGHRLFDLALERMQSPRTAHTLDAVVLKSADWVNIIPLTPDEQVVLIRQYRFGTEEITLEIPGGIVDPGEDPQTAATRELREETGFVPAKVRALGSIAPNPAIQRNRLHSFLAEGCVLAGEQTPDPSEEIAIELVPLAKIDALLASGAIHHALVAVAFQKLALLRAGHALG